MKKTSMTIPAGIAAVAILAGACAQRSVTPQSVPSRGGYALSDAMTAQCADEVAGLTAKLVENPALAAKGIEVRVPSSGYGVCLTDMLSKQTGREYMLTPIKDSVYATLTEVPQQ